MCTVYPYTQCVPCMVYTCMVHHVSWCTVHAAHCRGASSSLVCSTAKQSPVIEWLQKGYVAVFLRFTYVSDCILVKFLLPRPMTVGNSLQPFLQLLFKIKCFSSLTSCFLHIIEPLLWLTRKAQWIKWWMVYIFHYCYTITVLNILGALLSPEFITYSQSLHTYKSEICLSKLEESNFLDYNLCRFWFEYFRFCVKVFSFVLHLKHKLSLLVSVPEVW